METKDFISKLNEVQDLMKEEKYEEALKILDNLKEIERNGDFDYSLTHKLYQYISNSKSLFNQQIILGKITEISKNQPSITFKELNKSIKQDLDLSEDILRREIELLILRGLISIKIEGEKLIF